MTDDYLDRLQDTYVHAAELAEKAGFDGVDIKGCHRYLMAELQASHLREGRYGGSLENRTRLMRETMAKVREKCPNLLVTTRLNACDMMPYPYGFAMAKDGSLTPDLEETRQYITWLREIGIKFINLSIANPYYEPHYGRPYDKPIINGAPSPEHPLVGVARILDIVAQVQAMFDVIAEKAGRLDILVNNAANQGLGHGGPLEMKPEMLWDVCKTNIVGGFQVTQAACNRFFMKQEPNPATNQRGVVVFLGSNTSMRAIRNRTAYVTSKGGIDALVRSLSLDLGPLGIRVNEVAPGYIYTERWDVLDEKIKARRRLNCPLRHEATGGDIAEAVAYLASDAARNVGGERLVVDAGCSAQHMPEDVDF